MAEMNVAVLYEKQKIRFERREIPSISDSEVLIKTKHVGICGSDIHRYNCDWEFTHPMVLGHELSGIVVAAGKKVTTLKEGDLVTVEPVLPCGACQFCREGRYNLCSSLKCMPLHLMGAFSEYISFDAKFVYKLSGGMDTIDGALIEPLAVSLHAVRVSGATPTKSAVVLGAGPIGIFTVMILKAFGLNEIYVTDISQFRLDHAKKAGALGVFNILETEPVKAIGKLTNEEGADLIFESSGNINAAVIAPELVRRGGTIIQIGIINKEVLYDFAKIMPKEAVIKSAYKYCNDFIPAIKLISSGLLPVRNVVTQIFDFSRLNEALDFTKNNADACLKVIVKYI